MTEQTDPYWKLRPEPTPPEDEICQCLDSPPITLQDHLSSVPLACVRCNGEVPPERLGFGLDVSQELACWRDLHRAVYTLWLDSGEYEDWACVQLSDPGTPVNVRGFHAVARLNDYRRAFLWWFQDASADDFVPISACPRCGSKLSEILERLVCRECSILVPNG